MPLTDEQQLQHKTAIKIAIEAGVLSQCKTHPDSVFAGEVDIMEVYTLANEQYSKGKLEGIFGLRRELLEYSEQLIPKYLTPKCPRCN